MFFPRNPGARVSFRNGGKSRSRTSRTPGRCTPGRRTGRRSFPPSQGSWRPSWSSAGSWTARRRWPGISSARPESFAGNRTPCRAGRRPCSAGRPTCSPRRRPPTPFSRTPTSASLPSRWTGRNRRRCPPGRYLRMILHPRRDIRRDAFHAMHDTFAGVKNTVASTLPPLGLPGADLRCPRVHRDRNGRRERLGGGAGGRGPATGSQECCRGFQSLDKAGREVSKVWKRRRTSGLDPASGQEHT